MFSWSSGTLIKEFMRKSGSRMADEISVPETEAVLRKATADPNILMGLKQQIDELAMQAGLIEPPQTQPAGQPSPAMPTQGGQGGFDLQGLLQQLAPALQGLMGGGGQAPQQAPMPQQTNQPM